MKMALQVVGTVAADRRVELEAYLEGQHTTEHILKAAAAAGLEIDRFVNMDEYDIDIVVPLPDGLTLVYDTT